MGAFGINGSPAAAATYHLKRKRMVNIALLQNLLQTYLVRVGLGITWKLQRSEVCYSKILLEILLGEAVTVESNVLVRCGRQTRRRHGHGLVVATYIVKSLLKRLIVFPMRSSLIEAKLAGGFCRLMKVGKGSLPLLACNSSTTSTESSAKK